jgi:hypothetical protein
MSAERITELLPGVYRFEGETFYGEKTVGGYLVELPDRVVLVDIPAYRPNYFSPQLFLS